MARVTPEQKSRGVMEVDWPFFGELCRGLALKVWRDYEPDLVVGIAKAGVIPGAVISSILRVDFASVALTRRHEGEAPALLSRPTQSPRGRRVLLVDETCDSGDTMRLAASLMREEGAKEVRTAVSFRTAAYRPDYWAIQTPDFIILPWDRYVIEDGELVVRPDYEEALQEADAQTHGRTDAHEGAGGPGGRKGEVPAPRAAAGAARTPAKPKANKR